MATTRKSLASRAGAAARKVVSRGASATTDGAEATKKVTSAAAKKSTSATTTTPAKKTPAKKAATTTATKATAKKTPAKRTPATKAATKAPAKKTPAKKTPAKKTPAKRTPAKKTPATKTTKAAPAATSTRRAATAKKAASVSPGTLVVLEQEDPWTKAELKQVREQLTGDVTRLTAELHDVEEDLAGMIENSGEGAGNDQADVGSASFERDQEMVIVNNARDMLEQSQHALERIADGTYGKCEICGNPIGKNRLMAFPRATLCLTCKQREERR